MTAKKRKLPPLNALKAFESAARNLSFSKAANELHITQSAISKQVKILEEYFGTNLFERVNRGLKLTKKAEEYYSNISVAFDSIHTSTQLALNNNPSKNNKVITVNCFASFGTYWLIPRINNFKNNNPDIHIYISTGYGSEVEINESDCDVVIWGYKHSFKNRDHKKLINEEMMLVCAKSLLSSKINNISDLLKYPFLKNNYRPEVVTNWAKSKNIKPDLIKNTLSFDYLYMVIEAAKQGLGMAFVPSIFVKTMIKNGTLVNPLNIKYKTNFSYYAVYPNRNSKNPEIEKFSKWLSEELKK